MELLHSLCFGEFGLISHASTTAYLPTDRKTTARRTRAVERDSQNNGFTISFICADMLIVYRGTGGLLMGRGEQSMLKQRTYIISTC